MSKRKDTRTIKAEVVMHDGRSCIRFTTVDGAVVNFYLDAVKGHIETFKSVLNALKAFGDIATAAEGLRAITENSIELTDGCDHETVMKAEWEAVAEIIEKHAAGKPVAGVKWSIKGIDAKITTEDRRAIIAMLERDNPSFIQIDSNLKRVYELTENGNIHGYMYKRKDASSPWNLEKDIEVSFAKAVESLANCYGAVAALKTVKETGVSIYKFNHYQQKKLKETVWYTISNASENKATLKIETEDATLEKAFTWKKATAIESVEPVAESVEPVAVAETTPEPVAESAEPMTETAPEPVAESVEPVATYSENDITVFDCGGEFELKAAARKAIKKMLSTGTASLKTGGVKYEIRYLHPSWRDYGRHYQLKAGGELESGFMLVNFDAVFPASAFNDMGKLTGPASEINNDDFILQPLKPVYKSFFAPMEGAEVVEVESFEPVETIADEYQAEPVAVAETTPEPVAESAAESAEPMTETAPEPVAEIISYGTPARIISGELTTAEKRAVARIMTEKICTVEDAENSYHLGYNNTLEITSKASGETAEKNFTIKIETEKPVAESTAESVEPMTETTPEPVAESVEPVAETTPEPVAESVEPVAETTPEPVAESVEPVAETTPEPVAESVAVKARKPRKKKEPAESPALEYDPCIPSNRGASSLDFVLWEMNFGSVWSSNKKSLGKIDYTGTYPIITLTESTGGFYPRETRLDAVETFEKLEKDFNLESGTIWETLKAGKNIYCKKGDSMFNYNDKSYHGTIKSTYIYDSNAKIMTVITWLQATTWKKAKKVETRYNIPSYVGYSDLTISKQLIA